MFVAPCGGLPRLRNVLKSYEEIMEILEAFDLTGSLRAAGELAGCSHHTVEAYVARRDAGLLPSLCQLVERSKLIDPFLPKLEEWVERSRGKIRGDVVFDKLEPVGFCGSDRTVRRALAAVKANYRGGKRRVYRPWITEPGMWAQWGWGHGPQVGGRQTYLWCAWLAWCRFRVVIPTWDKTLPTVIGCLDRAMRTFGGAPTYWLTDNEKTVTTGHVAGIDLQPGGGAGPTAISDGGAARDMAVAMRNEVRGFVRSHRPSKLHLFLACPGAFAMLLGHCWDRVADTQVYADLAPGYAESYLIPN